MAKKTTNKIKKNQAHKIEVKKRKGSGKLKQQKAHSYTYTLYA